MTIGLPFLVEGKCESGIFSITKQFASFNIGICVVLGLPIDLSRL